MDADRYAGELGAHKRAIAHQRWIISGLVLALVLVCWSIVNSYGRERVVVTPPEVEKTFWVTSTTASAEYIEMMANWVASLTLDVTPDDIAYKTQLLLRYVHPEAHGRLKERMALAEMRIKRDSSATRFVPQTIHTLPGAFAAVLRGRLYTQIQGSPVADVERIYFIRFRYDGGRIQLSLFTEVLNADIKKLVADNDAGISIDVPER